MRHVLVSSILIALVSCGGNNNNAPKFQCDDGMDNDGDGLIDFPDDPGCTSTEDDSEDSLPSPQCSNGRDDDGDNKVDYPNDPGCFAPQQDDETDDCPSGPGCPQCANGMDDDMNGQTDYPNDQGCTSASDTDEYTENPAACGSNVHIKKLPFDGHAMGTFTAGQASNLMSPMCGGTGSEDVYELRIMHPKVVQATTDSDATTADTVLYIRSADCVNNTSELTCNDDVQVGVDTKSTVTASIATPGTYYLVVDAHDGGTSGDYDLQVKYFVGEGEPCSGPDDCGPSLVCRIPLGGTDKVCSKHVCIDGVDDDGDGKNDYPTDPGCSSPDDDDETDNCSPTPGPGCPECADGIDNDGDTKIDYPMDTTCTSAADVSEACPSMDGVTAITTAMTMGDTTGKHNDVSPTCASTTNAGDLTYRLDLPHLANLDISLTGSTFDYILALYNSTCGGTALACQDLTNISLTNVAAGAYYLDVDGYFTGDEGPYTINVSGKVVNGASCENALVQAGVLTCGTGYACKGTVGSRTCQPALCSDGIDNDGDTKIDFPFDPGCSDPADDTEADPATEPVCADGMDNDTDTQIDFPNDYGCNGAGGTTEVFCMPETDATALITQKTTTGTTVGKANDLTPSCRPTSAASDVTLALQLPVPVATLQIDTIGSGFDTVLHFHDAQCVQDLGCDDDTGGSLTSEITLSNVPPGGYAVVVDGYSSSNGAFTLNVHGTVAPQTRCGFPAFSGGASAILSCPTGTTCTGTPAKCQ